MYWGKKNPQESENLSEEVKKQRKKNKVTLNPLINWSWAGVKNL